MRFASRFLVTITAVGLLAVMAQAVTPTLTLSPNVGPPTTTTTVSGTGFPANVAVDIYFDTVDVVLAVASPTGALSGITVQVPSAAVPGIHSITAVSRATSGSSAQASYTVQTNWSQSGYSALHRGRNPYENVLNTTNVGTIDLDWSFLTGGAITSAPAVVSGTVYFGSADDNLYAVSAATGLKVWALKTGNSIVGSSPAVANGLVYIGSTDNNLYAVSVTTGKTMWTFPTGGAINSSPAVAGGTVYVGSNDNSVYAVSATTGAKVWKFPTGGAVVSSPAVSNGMVFVGSNDGGVYAINAATGAQVWKYTTGGAVAASPAISENVVFVGSADKNLYAINASTGLDIWKYTALGTV